MHPESHRGLAGKERRIRDRRRAMRLSTRQMIQEYLEPELLESQPRRHIPIRARSEFLPSVMELADVSVAAAFAHEPSDRRAEEESTATPPAIPVIKPKRTAPPVESRERTWKDVVIRFPGRSEASTNPTKPPAAPPVFQPPVDEPFRITGFLLGCAMGSVAAALVLLVARIAIGVLA